MNEIKDQIIALIQYKAEQDVADLSCEFARATSENREEIFYELEFNKWLAETCEVCLEKD